MSAKLDKLIDMLCGYLIQVIQNPHTSVPAFVVALCALGEIWLPQYEHQFHKTREFAISYGLLMAPQVKRKPGKGTNEQSKDIAGS